MKYSDGKFNYEWDGGLTMSVSTKKGVLLFNHDMIGDYKEVGKKIVFTPPAFTLENMKKEAEEAADIVSEEMFWGIPEHMQ
jgi:hypothetical protein